MNKFKIYNNSYICKFDALSFKGSRGVCVCVGTCASRQAHMRILLAGRLVPDIRDFQASWESYSFLPKLYTMQGKQKSYLVSAVCL